MKLIDKKDNFFAIAVQSGEKLVIADQNGQILTSIIAMEDFILNCYRKVDVEPLHYV